MSNRVGNAVPALAVVGLGMLLIAGLAGVVLWLVTRRRTVVTVAPPQPELAGGEPAEA